MCPDWCYGGGSFAEVRTRDFASMPARVARRSTVGVTLALSGEGLGCPGLRR